MRFALLLVLALLTGSCGRKPASPAVLRVGMELSYPPFEMTDEQGRPAGVSVDLARALAAALHRELQIVNIPFAGLIPALRTGKVDLLLSSMTATAERRQAIAFSDPYLSTGLALLVPASSAISSIEDLQTGTPRIAVKSGTTGYLYAKEHLPHARLLVLDKETACVLEVVQGKADAFIYDQLSTLANWQGHREQTKPLLRAFQAEQWAIGLPQGQDELRAAVNAFLGDFRAAGGFQRLGDKWLSEQRTAFQDLGVPFVF